MSYILDALHKADRERSGASACSTETFIQPAGQAPRQRRGIAVVLLLLAVLVVAGGWAGWQWQRSTATTLPADITSQPHQAIDRPATSPLAISIEGHLVVAPGHPANKLFTNRGVLRVGARLPSGWRLVAIGDREAVFSLEGEQQRVVLR